MQILLKYRIIVQNEAMATRTCEMMNSRELALSWRYPRHNRFRKELELAAKAWFEKKGFALDEKYSFRLDCWENWENNIILPEVVTYIKNIKEEHTRKNLPFPLHNNIHNGLSSQAMLFNLVVPLITRNDLEPLKAAISNTGFNWPAGVISTKLEYEDRTIFNEYTPQPTSIDLVIMDSDRSPRIFIESKLVEPEFGKCSLLSDGDCNGVNPLNNLSECYLNYVGCTYWQKLKEHGFGNAMQKETLCIFGLFYQFFRELLMTLEKGGNFILLCDTRSPVFYCEAGNVKRGLLPFLQQYIPEEHRPRLKFITVQDLIKEIKKTARHTDWIGEFEEKYGLTPVP